MSAKDTADKINQDLRNRLGAKINILAKSLLMGTPVGDPTFWSFPPPANYVGGHAKKNWQKSLGSPATNEIDGVDPGGTQTLATMMVTDSDLGQVIYFSNNVKYIRRLEYGYSKRQAPNGWVRLAVQRVGIGEANIK